MTEIRMTPAAISAVDSTQSLVEICQRFQSGDFGIWPATVEAVTQKMYSMGLTDKPASADDVYEDALARMESDDQSTVQAVYPDFGGIFIIRTPQEITVYTLDEYVDALDTGGDVSDEDSFRLSLLKSARNIVSHINHAGY